MKIALTGGIACGKSLAASFLSARDVDVCEADELAHRTLMAGTDSYAAVVDRFGQGILAESEEIDRSVLAERVFSSEKDLAALNALVHPAVEAAWNTWLEEREGAMAVVVVPLLFEAGYGQGWDAVICVCASLTSRMARLLERGLTASQAEARMRAQWPERDKVARADYVLWNDGSIDCLDVQVVRMLDSMKRGQ